MIEFLTKYWHIIVDVFSLIAAFAVLFYSRKHKLSSSIADEALLYIHRVLPDLIVSVEQLGYKGEEKKEVVISTAMDLMAKKFGRKLSSEESVYYRNDVSSAIEDILSTPTKKEVKNETI